MLFSPIVSLLLIALLLFQQCLQSILGRVGVGAVHSWHSGRERCCCPLAVSSRLDPLSERYWPRKLTTDTPCQERSPHLSVAVRAGSSRRMLVLFSSLSSLLVVLCLPLWCVLVSGVGDVDSVALWQRLDVMSVSGGISPWLLAVDRYA